MYDYDFIKERCVSMYLHRDKRLNTYYASFKTYDGKIYVIDVNTPREDLYEINEVLSTSVIIGYGLKGQDGKINILLNIFQGSPMSDGKKDWYSTFLFLDMLEFTDHPMLVASATGMDVNLEGNYVHQSMVEHDAVFKCLEVFKTDIDVKLQFQESDGFDIAKCLKTKTTSLTADAIYNGDNSEPERTKFSPKADLLAYFKMMLPISLITMYMSYYDNELRLMLKDSKYAKWFKSVIADNLIQWGLGGAHSIHIRYNMFNKDFNRWDGWVLLHIDGDAYYPNLMIKLKTMSRKMIFDKFVKYTEDRAKLKKLDDIRLKMIVLLLKIKVNAMYGLSGSEYSKLFDPAKQFDTVAHGQMIIVSLAQQLHNIGGIIFQTNTDGLYVAIPKERRADVKLIRDHLTSLTGIDFDEDEVDLLYQKNVNNYIKIYAPNKEGKRKTEVKGKELCGDYDNKYIKSKEFPIVHKAVYEYLINNVPIANTIMDLDNHDISWYLSSVYKAKGLSIRYAEHDRVTYRGGEYDGYKMVTSINKASANVTRFKELYTFNSPVVRVLPTKVVDTVKVLLIENANTNKLERVKRNLTGDNPVFVMDELSNYNKYDYDIDFDFLIEIAQKRVDEVVNYEANYNDKKRVKQRESYGMKG